MLFGTGRLIEPSRYVEVLTGLRGCRIWLSSRKEFFEHNPIQIGQRNEAGPDTLAVLQVAGIGCHRAKVVKNIFDKYRKRNAELYVPFLNEEYFISDIDRAKPVNISEMSFNPLFLTVMCYVYVTRVARERSHSFSWLEDGLEDLIASCISLLLIDLDNDKARNLTQAHRDGLLRRRNEYPGEKGAFLCFFAAELLFNGIAAFSLSDIKAYAITFFRNEPSVASHAILSQFETPREGRHDIAVQMIYDGVFVLVSSVKRELYYDFPHRRFREVLALQFIDSFSRYYRALMFVERLDFQEFMFLLRGSKKLQQRDFQSGVLQYLLHQATCNSDVERDLLVSRAFFRVQPNALNLSAEVKSWLTEMACSSEPRFELSREMLKLCVQDQQLSKVFLEAAEGSLAEIVPLRFALAMRILAMGWPILLSEFMRRNWGRLAGQRELRIAAIQVAVYLDRDVAAELLKHCESNPKSWADLSYALANELAFDSAIFEQWLRVAEAIPHAYRPDLLAFVRLFAPKEFSRCAQALGLSANVPWFEGLAELVSTGELLPDRGGQMLYIRTEDTLPDFETMKEQFGKQTALFKTSDDNYLPQFKLDPVRQPRYRAVPCASIPEIDDILTLLRRGLLKADGSRKLDGWAVPVEKAPKLLEAWLKGVTDVSIHGTTAPLERLVADLIRSIDGKVNVRLGTLGFSTPAWHYKPPALPRYFR